MAWQLFSRLLLHQLTAFLSQSNSVLLHVFFDKTKGFLRLTIGIYLLDEQLFMLLVAQTMIIFAKLLQKTDGPTFFRHHFLAAQFKSRLVTSSKSWKNDGWWIGKLQRLASELKSWKERWLVAVFSTLPQKTTGTLTSAVRKTL